MLYRIVHEEPDLQPLRDLDPELAEVVASCLDKDHEGRPTAAELVERAAAHGPSAATPWPQDITERLTERAAFAARVPDPAHLPEPDEPDGAEGAEEAEGAGGAGQAGERVPAAPSAPAAADGQPEKRPRRGRTKVLAFVIPIAVTGATLGFTLLPYAMNDADEGGNAAAPPAATGTAAPGPAASATGPSGSASPSPDGGKKDDKEGKDDKDGKDTAKGEESGRDGDGGAPGGDGAGTRPPRVARPAAARIPASPVRGAPPVREGRPLRGARPTRVRPPAPEAGRGRTGPQVTTRRAAGPRRAASC
ncbi:hypothetical protein SVIOM342S_06451 [Streptomyces violaceorubidus]